MIATRVAPFLGISLANMRRERKLLSPPFTALEQTRRQIMPPNIWSQRMLSWFRKSGNETHPTDLDRPKIEKS